MPVKRRFVPFIHKLKGHFNMSSLLTNTAALTALITLRQVNQNLDKTNDRISTGHRIETSADGAAYWSIATTIRADNGSLNAVKDGLGLGSTTVDTAYTGINRAITAVQAIKDKLTNAKTPGLDRAKLQTEIDASLNQLKQISDTSVINGESWLSVDSSAGNYSATRKVVSSFARINGQLTISTIDVSLDTTKLYDAVTTAGTKGADAKQGNILSTYQTAQTTYATAQDTFNKSSKDATAVAAINTAKANFDTATATYNSAVAAANKAAVAGTPAAKDGTGGLLNKQFAVWGADANGFYKAAALSFDKMNIAYVTDADPSLLNQYINLADKVLSGMTDVATKLGAIKGQIESQTNFVDSLIKANERSIGTLVDADMEEESTKLKAVQVQQQLGIQALSIANGNMQQVLSLFRN